VAALVQAHPHGLRARVILHTGGGRGRGNG
jgi:hypothetical protein